MFLRSSVLIGEHIETGQLKLISEIDKDTERGLKCQCVCADCGSPLVARMGEKVAHYFAHHRREDYSQACGETAIHLLAKVIILRSKQVSFPIHSEVKEGHDDLYEKVTSSLSTFREKVSLIEPVAEHYLPTASFKPDVFAKLDLFGELHDVAIEIAVTHFVDEEKYLKVSAANINMLEVDLSKLLFNEGEITQESVEKELAKIRNWKWIHKDPSWVEKIKALADKDIREQINKRNNEIKAWCDKLRDYYSAKRKLKLPRYVYSDEVNNPRIRSDNNRPIYIDSLPAKPNIEETLEVESVGELKNGIIEFSITFHNNRYKLPLKLTSKEHSQLLEASTHLILSPQLDGLPKLDILEKVIYWGYNQAAITYEQLVNEKLKQEQVTYDSIAKSKILRENQKNIQLYEAYLTGEKEPVAANIEKIKGQARQYWVEMKRNGVPVNNILQEVSNGWIFGCEQVWQVFVMYAMCLDDSAHGRAREIYDRLRNELKLYPLWPIAELHKSLRLRQLDYDVTRLIDPEGVITAYLDKLSDVRVVMPPIGLGYEKRFKCGHRFVMRGFEKNEGKS